MCLFASRSAVWGVFCALHCVVGGLLSATGGVAVEGCTVSDGCCSPEQRFMLHRRHFPSIGVCFSASLRLLCCPPPRPQH